ncbi:hypothetical protein ACIBI9_49990 [Nonomuraea sp. NPDC050451]|uniref:hypothetical protein n=1 Tax=Nonomuraea sp. NPDC050451 TaxID=3364364 RepID=UPI0037AF0B49
MTAALTALADRLLERVVPRAKAGACDCTGNEFHEVCVLSTRRLYNCQLNCYCNYINCVWIGYC